MSDPTARENFETMRKRPKEEFWAYLWDYYRKPALVVLFILVCIGSFVYELCTQKDMVFCGMMMDTYKVHEDEPFVNDFAEFAEINLNKEAIHMINNLSMTDGEYQSRIEADQLFTVKTAAGEVDVITLNTMVFQAYERDLMIDLRTILSEEQLAAIGDDLYYVDMANLIPGSTDPTGFEDPVPVGIDMKDCENFAEYYMPANNDCIMGICVNSENLDYAVKFVEFMYPLAP